MLTPRRDDRRWRWLLCAAATVGCLASPDRAAAVTLELGVSDQATLSQPAPADEALALARIKQARGSIVRVGFRWSTLAPAQPPTRADAQNPAWSGYRFGRLDTLARAANSAGLRLVPFITRAPGWAEGAGRPSLTGAPAGTWKPSSSAFGDLATALARRYTGTLPDPADASRTLPRIDTWQVWNEPNLAEELTPVWRQPGNRPVPSSPALYRGLLNAFYTAAKAVDPKLQIVTAGTAPFGDLPGGARMPPVTFWRSLLCLPGSGATSRCPDVRFDAYAHHPYPIGPPYRKARNPEDVSVPDLGKLTPLVRRAVRDGHVLPRGPKPLWITEISWDSAPDPDGLTLGEQAKYLAGGFSLLQRSGARVVCWFGLRDQAAGPGWASTYQSGLYTRGRGLALDVPKPSLAAFAFPFTAYRTRGVAQLWGVSPADGEVVVEAQVGSAWTVVARGPASARSVFTFKLRSGIGTRLRARVGADIVSPEWVTS